MSDTTDLMGARVEETAAAPATDASAPASGAGSRRRRGTGLEGMVLAELQQVASGLGIRGTARMRKSQLIEVIKEAQAGGGAAAPKAASAAGDATETKPKRRATSKARTGEAAEKKAEKAAEAPAEKAVAQQQIEIPGQPASEDAPVER
ncbi:Rho termination factor N-terminal domain-containing protein, partial [Streptomyces sp. T21Q-yed]